MRLVKSVSRYSSALALIVLSIVSFPGLCLSAGVETRSTDYVAMGVGSTGCVDYLQSYRERTEKLNYYAAWSQGAITTLNALSAGQHKFDIRHVLTEVAEYCEENDGSSFSDALIDVIAPEYLSVQ